MQFRTLALTTLLSTATTAAPIDKHQPWTIKDLSRTCPNVGSCSVSLTIVANNGASVTPCTFTVRGPPATSIDSDPAACGDFSVSQQWTGQFGSGKPGSTMITVKNEAAKLVVHPIYGDGDIGTDGKVHAVEQSFMPIVLV